MAKNIKIKQCNRIMRKYVDEVLNDDGSDIYPTTVLEKPQSKCQNL